MSTQKRERRFIPARELRVSGNNGKRVLTGYAAVFNSKSEDLGGFYEQIKPGAFTRCLNRSPDVVCLREHDPRLGVLGRTRSGTLRLKENQTGLRFEADLPNTTFATDLEESINRGDLDACSFGFIARADDWSRSADGTALRTLIDVDVFDVSVVTFPAYPATSAQMRGLMFPDGAPDGVRSRDNNAFEQKDRMLAAVLGRRMDFRSPSEKERLLDAIRERMRRFAA
jgi:Escherichia/Staphylococcus phage prohead protease